MKYIARNTVIEYEKLGDYSGENVKYITDKIRVLCDCILDAVKNKEYYSNGNINLGEYEFIYRNTRFFASFSIDVWDLKIEVSTTEEEINFGKDSELENLAKQISKFTSKKLGVAKIVKRLV